MTMRFALLLVFTLGFWPPAQAQTTLSGTVSDAQGAKLPGANVYLKDTYDGATTDTAGFFSFVTTETGTQTLVTSYVGYEDYAEALELKAGDLNVNPVLKEAYNAQNTVLITAGGFGSNDEMRAIVLNPLDIVTTAGAAGDVYGALQYLPGTQAVGEENGLFVRGGDASETVTVIDELIVQQPFFSSVPDIPSRSRFNPFLFKGTFFSTGGYSARYGQAMSSALVLNTQDMPDTSSAGLNLSLVGVGGFHNQKWGNTALALSGNYSDVTPLFLINKQAPEWEIAPRAGNGGLIFRHKPNKSSIIKAYTNYNYQRFVVKNANPFDPETISRTKLGSHNLYSNVSYRSLLNEDWVLFVGASHSWDSDQLNVDGTDLGQEDSRIQAKAWLSRNILKNSKIWFGGESHLITSNSTFGSFSNELEDHYSAGFVESEIYLSPKVATRIGGRVEHSGLIGKVNAAPRLSFAIKASKYGTVSVASGQFYQTPTYGLNSISNNLGFERSDHLLANYTWAKQKRTFRVEAYQKRYRNLVTDVLSPSGTVSYDNGGFGYARGIDFFWRDQTTIQNGEYWLSYSYLDTKRLYRNFPVEAMPSYASNHNASFVYKHFIAEIRMAFGASYLYGSGRPYENPNLSDAEFLSERTPAFHLVSLNASYLTTIKDNFTVVFLSVGNVLGRNNVFGYRYSPDGQFRLPVNPTQRRSVFLGMFISFR